MSRIRVFTGHFGSGKTEIAINYAINLAKEGKKVVIVDLDIVNPYFCVRDVRKQLEDQGIRVIASNPELVNAELMVVPAEIRAAFNDKSYEVVIDVGGDDSGSIALGQYNKYFKEEAYDMFFVINTNRPFTQEPVVIVEYIKAIEKASRLTVTHLISNTNLSYETVPEHIIYGDKVVAKLSKELNIPHEYTVCSKDLVGELKGKLQGDIFGIDIHMLPPWR
ncbi:ATP-binding protein [Clostridium sp.]|uniref:nucleotide-binding protein n=1 Tax=Clostridium sp. TaxID=1506 RepID=UPI001A3C7EFE|nr:ATP-binding protein [Clostridium sp.]MBK5240826.1 ATP-binding protein [Clostridium sp.]